VAWDAEDDSDAAVWADPAVRPLRVRVLGSDQAPVGGVPVTVLAKGGSSLVLAGPKMTNAEGRVRFPIDVSMEQQHEILVAARAIPGRAAESAVKVAVDQAADVTLVVETGIRGLIHVVDPDGRPVEAARVRKAILGEPAPESGPSGDLLSRAFAEATPRATRVRGGFELVGLAAPEEFTLVVSAPGYAPVYQPVRVPPHASNPHTIDVRLLTRTSVVRFELLPPAEIARERLAFSCHRVGAAGLVLAAGFDEVPAQQSPQFALEVSPEDPQRLELCAWVDGRIHASGELDVPGLREGEVLDAGRIRLEVLPVVLAGRVVDQDHSPLANATVEAIGRGRSRDLAATTGKDGGFLLRAPSGRGPYQVSAHAVGRVSEKVAGVSDPALDLRFVLEPSGALQGSVLLPAGIESDRISVRAATDGRSPFTTTLLPGGSFLLAGLPRGVYTVVIDGAGIHPIRVSDVVVNPPETTKDGRLDRLRPRAVAGQGQP
jgi:hypothetical protein